MTKEQFASGIDGRKYRGELYPGDVERAKENGLVFVYGASDDLIEFSGAINDEGDCFDGGIIHFDKNGVSGKGSNEIIAVWCGTVNGESVGKPEEFQAPDGTYITWCYKTEIPHATFMIYDDGEPYCRGIVFSIEDVK